MRIHTDNLVSMTEANQNFSKVAKMVDNSGSAIILKNNKPKYLLIQYEDIKQNEYYKNEDIEDISKDILNEFSHVFEELAK
ncbi:type II toxin-antitoxin system Phd/YefM family antitoxin [Anaerococcus sp. NML200574]|uniref:Type II toxin-antitoxin system Phd/YefM family antitoxin n=1 Tax=Anaerococcus kampingae TaxID=3115614 RepID=A0ABW9MBB8_9FIRM|nr:MULTISPECIES: type II toxin-antitoxin system Phd/YefM family antitoxin [unclassified Anaerococcus]MCW6679358.1 type II toxin-antitoxin system Phd/YefM family antitoxin [Anaerococcus sp. NML200574]MCW6702167.1 type II toxin-antitoxin system Phd/YefM family antitoxin [Anaerococcus sp. NML200537]